MAGHRHKDEREDLRRAAEAGRRTLEWPAGSNTFFFLVKDHGGSLYVGFDLAFHVDAEGRPRRAFVRGIHYLRGLDGRVLRKIPERRAGAPASAGPLERREVEEVWEVFHGSVNAALASLDDEERRGRLAAPHDTVAAVRDYLQRASQRTPARLAEESRRFLEAYAPLGVLPPDCYRNLILQATAGCSYNRCAFCALYKDTPYRVKSVAEFREHVARVRAFLGRALLLRRGVFLGEANALEVPQDTLVEILEAVADLVPEALGAGGPRGGAIHGFSDVFTDRSKGPREFRRLADLGLGRVYLGVESGARQVLARLRKPVTADAVRRRVGDLKEGGIAVGLIFLVGAGERNLRRAHVDGTLELVRGLPLDNRDIVYLSPLTWPSPQILDGAAPVPAEPRQLSSAELAEEEKELAEGIRAHGARVGHYDLAAFVYG